MNARTFALVFGVVYLLVGLMGFFVNGGMSISPGGGATGADAAWPRLLGLFPINLLHNIVHLAIGAWGLASYRSYSGSVAYARGLAILYAVLAVMGLIPGLNTTFGLIPIFGHDVWLHALTAIVAAYFGWMATRDVETIDASRATRR